MIPLAWDGARPSLFFILFLFFFSSLFFKAPQVILMCRQGGESLTQFLVWLRAAQTTRALEPSLVGLCSRGTDSESGFGFPPCVMRACLESPLCDLRTHHSLPTLELQGPICCSLSRVSFHGETTRANNSRCCCVCEAPVGHNSLCFHNIPVK